MATSSFKKEFIIDDEEKVNKFLDAIEESYQESLTRNTSADTKITFLKSTKEIEKFMERRKA